jgi:hypothetical protein
MKPTPVIASDGHAHGADRLTFVSKNPALVPNLTDCKQAEEERLMPAEQLQRQFNSANADFHVVHPLGAVANAAALTQCISNLRP